MGCKFKWSAEAGPKEVPKRSRKGPKLVLTGTLRVPKWSGDGPFIFREIRCNWIALWVFKERVAGQKDK